MSDNDQQESSLIDYPAIVQEALRSVVAVVLCIAEDEGAVPGEHAFYIAFRTDHPGVELSKRMRLQYPQNMTIILQHQFDSLTVEEDYFAVTLYFKGVAERIKVPFSAIVGFSDNHANFGLQFDAIGVEGEEGESEKINAEINEEPEKKTKEAGKVVSLDSFRKK